MLLWSRRGFSHRKKGACKDTPRLYRLLQRVMGDASNATAASRKKYRHARSFMLEPKPPASLRKRMSFLRARAKNLPPQRDCKFEKHTLKPTRWLTP